MHPNRLQRYRSRGPTNGTGVMRPFRLAYLASGLSSSLQDLFRSNSSNATCGKHHPCLENLIINPLPTHGHECALWALIFLAVLAGMRRSTHTSMSSRMDLMCSGSFSGPTVMTSCELRIGYGRNTKTLKHKVSNLLLRSMILA